MEKDDGRIWSSIQFYEFYLLVTTNIFLWSGVVLAGYIFHSQEDIVDEIFDWAKKSSF